jgi:predicted metal-dependent HD superfamily phosphohydrolase
MMSFPWSQVQDTPLASIARELISYNKCEYHNWDHIVSMYQYLADTNEPYDEALDWAVLFHDIVYDEKPEKEYRSVEVFAEFVEVYEGCTPDIWERDRVCKLILCTVDHIVTQYPGSSAIVRADLHGLTNRLTSFENFGKIMKESMRLYGIDEVEFAKNSEQFMSKLSDRVASNPLRDREHFNFYEDAVKGITFTIYLSRLMQGKAK